MRELRRMECGKEKVFFIIMKEESILENGMKIKCMEGACYIILITQLPMMDSGERTASVVSVLFTMKKSLLWRWHSTTAIGKESKTTG